MPKGRSKPRQLIIAYVPALHAGYKRLFDKYPHAAIYVFGADIIGRFDQLRKELRQLAPEDACKAIAGWGRQATVVSNAQLAALAAEQPEIIMPDEDVSHTLAAGELAAARVTFEPIFLRWDRRRMESRRDPVNPDHTVSAAELDRKLMTQAADAGRASSNLWRRMGALIVRDGNVLAHSYNHSHPTVHTSWIDGDPRNNAIRGVAIDLTTDIHAEAGAIAEAARRGIALAGTTMYVVDFPCPTCAKLIANAGISRLYYGRGYSVLDGEQALKAGGVQLIHVTGLSDSDAEPEIWVPYPEKQ